jgi:Amt family ammonium transporter
MATAVISFQWFFWGYSLAFSHSAGKYIGNLDNFGLMDVLAAPSVGSSRIPDLMFCVYQGMFAAITYAHLQPPLCEIKLTLKTVSPLLLVL